MPKFPTEEAQIIALAQKVSGGIATNPSRFSAPPVNPKTLEEDLTQYNALLDQVTAARAAFSQAVESKNSILNKIIDGTKDNIAYAEIVAKGDDSALKEIGWGTRAQPTKLQKPAQTTYLAIVEQGEGCVCLTWKEPRGGGKPASYIVQRSEDGGLTWTEAKTAVEPEASLVNQPKAKRLLYQVVAINRTGTGEPSNIVALTL